MNIISLSNKKQNISLPELYEKYFPDIFKYSFSILKDTEEAKDAVHEVFVKYAESENSYKGNCSIKTWLLVITRNYCFNRIKSKKFNEGNIDEDIFDKGFNPEYEIQLSIKDALLNLSPEQNELVYLKDYEGYSYKEIAEITEQSLENVKIKLYRARRQLRNYLKGEL